MATRASSSEAVHLCPHCGQSVANDTAIHRDGFVLDPAGTVEWNGIALSVSSFEAALLYILAESGDRMVTRAAVRDRLGSNGGANVITVLTHRLRKELKRIGAPDVIEIVWGRGLRWKPADGSQAARG